MRKFFRLLAFVLAKLAVFNIAVIGMYLVSIFIFQMTAVLNEYREMGLALTIFSLVLGNITLLIYDVLVKHITILYVHKLRGRLMK